MSDEITRITPEDENNLLEELRIAELDALKIKKQNLFSAFFKAGKNTKDLASGLSSLTEVTKWELNMLLLVLNSQVNRVEEYKKIMESIDSVEKELLEDEEQKMYLQKVRTALQRIKERDDSINSMQIKIDSLESRLASTKLISILSIVIAVIAVIVSIIL